MTSNLPKSIRKFIRLEKARIRVQFFDQKKQEEMITELYKKLSSQPVIQTKAQGEPKKEEKKTTLKAEEKKAKAPVKAKKEKTSKK